MSVYKRGNTYWVRFQWNNQEIRRPAKTAVKAEAMAFERELRAQLGRIHRGGKPRFTVDQAMERFIDEYLPRMKPRAADRYSTSINMMLPYFEGKYLDQINKATISEYVTGRRREGVTDATIRRDLACLSRMCTCAVNWDWLEHNPIKSYDKSTVKESRPRVRFLTQKEYQALLAAAPDDECRRWIVFAKETGMRWGEQFLLKHSQIDKNSKQVRLEDTKTGEPRSIPLSPEAYAQLSAQPVKLRCPYVFPQESGAPHTHDTFRARWEKTLKMAGIESFTWHDLRHTFASWAIKGWHAWQVQPMPQNRLQKWLGHAGPQMTQRYAHLDIADLQSEVSGRTKTGTKPTDLKQQKKARHK